MLTAVAGATLTGTTCSGCKVVVYHARGNPAAPHGGGELIQLVLADGAGLFTTTLPDGRQSWQISMLACTAGCGVGSVTSEMSPRAQVFAPLIKR